jgi:integrase
MANLRVSIWVYRKIDGKWRYRKPAVGRNNKIVPEEGTYYIRWREGSRLRWRKSSSAANAVLDAKRQEAYLVAFKHGLTPKQEWDKNPPPLQMVYAMPAYLEEYKLSNRIESYNLMRQTLEEFHAHCRKNLISAISRIDLLKYKQWCIEHQKNKVRTGGNKMLRVAQFLRHVQKQKPGEGLVSVKDARWVELEPEVYTDKELASFFYHCTAFQYAVFKCLLMAGLRKAELEFLTWDDVDLDAGTVRVTAKAEFSPKTWEERTVEIPKELVNILKELPRKSRWVYANGAGNRYTHMWDDAKVIGKKAKIANCHPHKFRSTFATRLLHGGMDLKTVQKLLGHKNLESTMRYLAKAESSKVREKVNAVWA